MRSSKTLVMRERARLQSTTSGALSAASSNSHGPNLFSAVGFLIMLKKREVQRLSAGFVEVSTAKARGPN